MKDPVKEKFRTRVADRNSRDYGGGLGENNNTYDVYFFIKNCYAFVFLQNDKITEHTHNIMNVKMARGPEKHTLIDTIKLYEISYCGFSFGYWICI